MEKYHDEVKKKWHKTIAYKQYEEKRKHNVNFNEGASKMMDIFKEIDQMKHLLPSDIKILEKIEELQKVITMYFYECNLDILSHLGQIYADDYRFMKNIDSVGGKNTAKFVSNAIFIYCQKNKI